MKYTIKHVAPQMSIDFSSDRALLVGIQSTIRLQIDLGTVTLNQVSENRIIIRVSDFRVSFQRFSLLISGRNFEVTSIRWPENCVTK